MTKNQGAGKGINGDADVCGGKGTPEGVSGKRTPEGGAGKNMKQFLLDKIAKRKIVAGVVGLGYVGLPLAVEKAKAGFKTIGFDVQKSKVDSVNAGHNYIGDVVNADLKKLVEEGRLMATEDFSFIKEVDFVAICVPTPLDEHQEPDISYVKSSAESIAKYIHPNIMVEIGRAHV